MLTPAIAAPALKGKPPAVALTLDPLTSFTPASADPKLAASFAGRAPALAELKFTPAAAKGRPSQVRVAIRAPAASGQSRVAEAASANAASPVSALTPTTYKLGVSVGWKRFAVSGDVAKSSAANNLSIGERESAVVGVSYSINKKLTGRVAVGAERNENRALEALRQSDNVSVDVGGAYNITRNIAVTGGVRYRIDRDRYTPLADDRQDSQAVYVGTAFKF